MVCTSFPFCRATHWMMFIDSEPLCALAWGEKLLNFLWISPEPDPEPAIASWRKHLEPQLRLFSISLPYIFNLKSVADKMLQELVWIH